MLKDKYYDFVLEHKPVSKSEEIVFSLMHDLSDRSGYDWGGTDDDIQEEWFQDWIHIVDTILRTVSSEKGE